MNDTSKRFSEETLLAFADGTLAGDQAKAVEAALARDPGLQETLRLLRLGSTAVAHAFDQTLDEPLPARLLETARRPLPEGPERRAGGRWIGVLAACLAALAIGLGTGYFLRAGPGGYSPASEATLDPLSAHFQMTLLSALDSGKPGEAFDYAAEGAGKGKIELGDSFRTAFGSECREFRRLETRGTTESAEDGIACRGADQAWNMMMLSARP
jgi:hypothetical protein